MNFRGEDAICSMSRVLTYVGPWGKASELSLLLSLLARPAIGIPNRNLSDPSVRIDDIEEWQKELLADPKNRLAMLAFEKSSPDDILQSNAIVASDIHIFNTKINVEGQPPTDQENTERCWLFAAMNIFRIGLTRKYNLPELKLSQVCRFPLGLFQLQVPVPGGVIQEFFKTVNLQHIFKSIRT